MKNINCTIVGAQGYSGLDLSRLILDHPHFNLKAVISRETKWTLKQDVNHPAAGAVVTWTPDELLSQLECIDVIFLATPVEVSMSLIKTFMDAGKKVVDLSGAFRLPKDEFEKWYGVTHPHPELIEKAVYGLQPWCNVTTDTQLVSNPGCYATAIASALIPLASAGLLKEGQHVIADAKSGVSGAGREPKKASLFAELDGSFVPYKLGNHQHIPEILKSVKTYGGALPSLTMIPHLLPVKRGIQVSLYFPELAGKKEAVLDAYHHAFKAYPLVQIHDVKNSGDSTLALSYIVNTPYVQLHVCDLPHTLVIFSSLDNLLKGAASQAMENANAFYGYPLTTGLLNI